MFLKRLFASCREVIRHPIWLIPTVILGLIWVGLGYLGAVLKEMPIYLKVANFVTYAQGGLYGGNIAALGGILGKTAVAAFLNALIIPALNGRGPFGGFASGIKGFFSNVKCKSAGDLSKIFGGCGVALLLYSFMNSRQNLQEALVGIVATVFVMDNIGKKNGLITCLIYDIFWLFSGRKAPASGSLTRFLSGLAIGFTMAVAISASPYKLCVILGIAFIIFSFFSSLFRKKTGNIIPQGAAMILAIFVGLGAVCPFVLLSCYMEVNAAGTRWVDPYTYYGVNDIFDLYPKMRDSDVSMIKAYPVLDDSGENYRYLEDDSAFTIDLGDGKESVCSFKVLEEDYYGDVTGEYDVTLTFTGDPKSDALFRVKADWEERIMAEDSWYDYDEDSDYYFGDSDNREYEVINGTVEECTVCIDRKYEKDLPDPRLIKIDFGRPYSIYLFPDKIQIPGNDKKFQDGDKYAGTYSLIFRSEDGKTKGTIELNVEVTKDWAEVTYSGDKGVIKAAHKVAGRVDLESGYFYLEDEYVPLKESYLKYLETGESEAIDIDKFMERYGLDEDWNGEIIGTNMILKFDTSKEPYTIEGNISQQKIFFEEERYEVLEFWLLETKEKKTKLPPIFGGKDKDSSSNGNSGDGNEGNGNNGNESGGDGNDDDNNNTFKNFGELIQNMTAGGENANVHRDEKGSLIISFVGATVSILLGTAGGAAGGAAGAATGGATSIDLGPYIKRDEDGDLVVNDPATGEKRTYVANGDGTYTNPLSGATYDEQGLKNQVDHIEEHADHYRQTQETYQKAAWEQREANQYLSQDGQDYLKSKHELEAKQQREDQLDKMWYKYGGERGDEESIRKAMDSVQLRNEQIQQRDKEYADRKDFYVKTLEVTQVAADIGVDVLAGVTGQQSIKNAYTVGKNYASRLSDAYVNNKDMKGAIAMAGFDSLTDIGLDKASAAGFHITGNVSAELIKNTTQNLYEGKDWNKDWEKAALTGTAKGTVSKIASAFSDANKARTKEQLNKDYDLIIIADQSGASEKSIRAMQDIRLLNYVNNLHAETKVDAITTAAADLTNAGIDMAKE